MRLGLGVPDFSKGSTVHFGHEGKAGLDGWHQLMSCAVEHSFGKAKAEDRFDAVLIQVQSHPREIRTLEYADHCDDVWGVHLPTPYPSFEDWRREADLYVEISDD